MTKWAQFEFVDVNFIKICRIDSKSNSGLKLLSVVGELALLPQNWNEVMGSNRASAILFHEDLFRVSASMGEKWVWNNHSICFRFQPSTFTTVSLYSVWLDRMSRPNHPDTSVKHHLSFFMVTCVIPLILVKTLNEWSRNFDLIRNFACKEKW